MKEQRRKTADPAGAGAWRGEAAQPRRGVRGVGLVSLLLVLVAGCSAGAPRHDWSGPQQPAMLVTEGWNFGDAGARLIKTPHYNLYTTLDDEEVLANVAQLLEGAYEQYRALVPDAPVSATRMNTYLFQYRYEWAAFTEANTGDDASIYLQILRGGYTYGDNAVTYFIGDRSTYSVTSHEGWHQFVGRHFKSRLPPFLEEGIACLFENVNFDGLLPRWNQSVNDNRQEKLAAAVAGDHLWPLEQLLRMHAGEVVDQPVERIEAFYAQGWALARFLWEGDEARHRPAMQRLLGDAANGRLPIPISVGSSGNLWRPAAAKPLLEHYLQMPFEEIEQRYQAYVRIIAATD